MHPVIALGDHKAYMAYALSLARLSPPKPTNFCVGCVIINHFTGAILSTGYTLELEGNTHAEQCAIAKLLLDAGMPVTRGGEWEPSYESDLVRGFVEEGVVISVYTTMEPCAKRGSGNRSCVKRLLGLREVLRKVYVGVREPEIFVGENKGRARLEREGVRVVEVKGLEEEILEVARAGHVKEEGTEEGEGTV